jgi:hypothetical protein
VYSYLVQLGYDKKGVLRKEPETGFAQTQFRNRNFKSLFQFWLYRNRKLDFTGFGPEFTGINFPKNLIYFKKRLLRLDMNFKHAC